MARYGLILAPFAGLLAACQVLVVDPEAASKAMSGEALADPAVPAAVAAVPSEPKVSYTPPPPAPMPGSEEISFMDRTTAQLSGCRILTGMQVSHTGSFEDGLVVLRNRALAINANMMIPVKMIEAAPSSTAPHHYHVMLVRCPDMRKSAADAASSQGS